jgi:hypothetical protein
MTIFFDVGCIFLLHDLKSWQAVGTGHSSSYYSWPWAIARPCCQNQGINVFSRNKKDVGSPPKNSILVV